MRRHEPGAGADFSLLGPLEVARDGRALAIGGARQRALLALLLLHANELVPRERLIEGRFQLLDGPLVRLVLDGYSGRSEAPGSTKPDSYA